MCVLCHQQPLTCFLFTPTGARSDRQAPVVPFMAFRASVHSFSFNSIYFNLTCKLRFFLFRLNNSRWSSGGRRKWDVRLSFFFVQSYESLKTEVAVMRSNLWNSSSWKFRFCCFFSSPLFLGSKTWSLAPVFMVGSCLTSTYLHVFVTFWTKTLFLQLFIFLFCACMFHFLKWSLIDHRKMHLLQSVFNFM